MTTLESKLMAAVNLALHNLASPQRVIEIVSGTPSLLRLDDGRLAHLPRPVGGEITSAKVSEIVSFVDVILARRQEAEGRA